MNIVAISGSLRRASYNTMLLNYALELAKDHSIERVDLKALDLPIYNADDQDAHGLHPSAEKLTRLIRGADALLIATPEYNHGVPAGLKNAIDWVSRHKERPFQGKSALIMGASQGRYGAIHGIFSLRTSLMFLGVHVYPKIVSVTMARSEFDERGTLVNEPTRKIVTETVHEWLQYAGRSGAGKA